MQKFSGEGHSVLLRPHPLRRSTSGAPFRWIGHPPL